MDLDEMFVIEAERRGETTRFVVGCASHSAAVEKKLAAADFRILSVEFTTPPQRQASEQQRATKILGELFGH